MGNLKSEHLTAYDIYKTKSHNNEPTNKEDAIVCLGTYAYLPQYVCTHYVIHFKQIQY